MNPHKLIKLGTVLCILGVVLLVLQNQAAGMIGGLMLLAGLTIFVVGRAQTPS